MGKLLQPSSSLKVECSITGKPEMNKATSEYLEAYSDTYGEGPQPSSDSLPSPPKPASSSSRASSAGFARVLRKQTSISLMRLSSFGENIPTPRVGDKKKLEED